MKKYQVENYMVEPFVPLLNICLSEDYLNKIIMESEDLFLLFISLKVKHYYILQGVQQKISFPINKVLLHIANSNIESICEILELCILIQNVESATLILLDHLEKMYINEQYDIYIMFKLLYMITNLYYSLKLKFPIGFSEILIKCLYRNTFNSNSKQLQNCFCKLLPKYIRCSIDSQSILHFILSSEDLYTISCTIDIFLNTKIMKEEKFWVTIRNSLQTSDYNKKLSLNILKCYIQQVNKTGNFAEQLDIIKGNIKSGKEFSKCWSDYFILIEISEEKQLHLILPTLSLISKIHALHASWRISLYKIFLSHVQNSITFLVANMILKPNLVNHIDLFENVIHCLLPALNRHEYSDNFLSVFQNLKTMSKSFSNKHFDILLTEGLNLNWCPVSAWHFYSNIFAQPCHENIDFTLILSNFNHIKKIPHTFIREGCYLVLMNFFIKNRYFLSFDLNDFVNLAYELRKCDIKLLSTFYEFAHENLVIYNSDERIESEIMKFKKYTDKIEIFLHILKNKNDIFMVLRNLLNSKNVNKDEEGYLVLYLSKYYSESLKAVDYLKQKLKTLDSDKTLDVSCEIASYLKINNVADSSLVKDCKYMLLNPEKYNKNCIALAFKIYSCNLDEDIVNVVKIWNSKLIKGDKMQSVICKSYLHTYFIYLKSLDHSLSTPGEIYQILLLIFDTQPEDIWLDVYENFDTLLKNLQDEEILVSILEEMFTELLKFESKENFVKAWSSFIKILLNNKNIFAIHDIKTHLIRKISQVAQVNDTIAYIFIDELSKINDNILLFLNLIVELVLNGRIYRKDKRCEYYACREIGNTFKDKNKDNPIYLPCRIRCKALNIMLHILNINGPNVASSITKLLLEKYSWYYKQRYFPESQIHLSKLRITQAFLMLITYASDDNKRLIIDFIIDSLCEESHQSCVKQLMQLLLITLLENNHEYLDIILEKVNIGNKIHVSAIVAFIPVLYHMGRTGDEDLTEKLMHNILKWTMGAHFKLRVYSQVAMTKLLEVSFEKNYSKILCKYSTLYESLKIVLKMPGANVENALQTDKFLFDQFNIENHYNLETIYINIPQLNEVPETEWEFIDLKDFAYCKNIPLRGCKISTDNIVKKKINIINDIKIDDSVQNIQKKILSWEDLNDVEEEKNRSLTELIVVASLVDSNANLGGLARTSEIYGIKELVVSDRKIVDDKEFKSLSMSSEYWINIGEVKVDDLEKYLDAVKENGYLVIGAEQTTESVKLHNYKFPKKCVLVLGNEREGIPSRILPYLDVCIEIPQFGVVRSLNVHVAGAITIWEYVKQNVLQ